jgi:hypothetical protein
MDGAQAQAQAANTPLLLLPSTRAPLAGKVGLALPLPSPPGQLLQLFLPTPQLRGTRQPRPTLPSLVLPTRLLLKPVLVLLPLLVSLPIFCKQLHLA